MKSRNISSLADCINLLQSRGHYCFDRKQAVQRLSKSQTAFNIALYRLIKKGRVRRIKGDFYIIIPLEYRPLVMRKTLDGIEKNKRWHILVNEVVEADL